MKSAKWNGLKTRILSTIGIISSLGGLSYFFKEDGLSVFVVVLQAMMYREMTRTIGGDDWGTSLATVRKYWWFVTAVIAWNGPRLYPWKRGLLEAIAFTMTISTGLLTTILGFQYNRNGNIEFREYIRQTAVSLFSAALVVLPSYTTCPKTSDDKKEKQLLLLLYLFKNIETKIETKIKVIHHSLNLFTLYLIYFFNYCIHVHNVTVMLLYVTFFSCYSFSRSCLILFRSLLTNTFIFRFVLFRYYYSPTRLVHDALLHDDLLHDALIIVTLIIVTLPSPHYYFFSLDRKGALELSGNQYMRSVLVLSTFSSVHQVAFDTNNHSCCWDLCGEYQSNCLDTNQVYPLVYHSCLA